MPSVAPYIPNTQAAFSNWLNNFSTLITASPSTYGLLTADAVVIAGLYSQWIAAYTPITSPSTKTAQAVSNKNTTRVTVTSQVRVYAQQISNNPGVAAADKIALGVSPKTSTPSPISPPASTPILSVQFAGPSTLTMRYRDSAASVSVKSKPYGVASLQYFWELSATPITQPSATGTVGTATKSPFVVNFGSLGANQQAYLWGRWLMKNGGFSPWSPIVSYTVPIAG
jgi:hypothetical protein